MAEWLASGEATRQTVSSAIGRATGLKEAHDKATQPPAAAEEANPDMNNPALLEEARNALGPE